MTHHEDRMDGTSRSVVVKYQGKWAVFCPVSCTYDLIGAGYRRCREFCDKVNAVTPARKLEYDMRLD